MNNLDRSTLCVFWQIVICMLHKVVNVFIGFFFFQAEDGIRDLVRSRGLGDVYKRQPLCNIKLHAARFGVCVHLLADRRIAAAVCKQPLL